MAEIELWDARSFDWEDDDFYALLTTHLDLQEDLELSIQDYYGDITGHRIDAFAETEHGCRDITLVENHKKAGDTQ
ncbi:hypothetical protein [Halomontanus rarus]|uniref:hypothetical protein n=1 Tax=Halomontanus rarus TaxID=3034020 RepID=UPI001A98EFEE